MFCGKMSFLRRVVVISKDDEIQKLARQVSREIFIADDLVESIDILRAVTPDLIIIDSRYSPNHIQEYIITTDNNSVNVPIVVVKSDENNNIDSSQFIKIGVYDFLHSKEDSEKLRQIVQRIVNESEISTASRKNNNFFVDECAASIGIAGRSKAFVNTFNMIKLVAESKCDPVLITGETGTGKELAARAVHKIRHPKENFVAINCASLTANLLESELFGHVKGSFTGADRDKAGLLEMAGTGTIFLDEISEMPLDLQAKILRVLQERTFRKVGGIKDVDCRATIIASSNRNLDRETKANRFRGDLYYRLNICPINIAALRSPYRREDIPILAEYFIRTSTICPEKNEKIYSITNFALETLMKHDWPGNVRELRNVIDRAILFETTDKIGLSSIILNPADWDVTESGAIEQATIELPSVANQAPQCQNSTALRPKMKDFSLAKAERELVTRALAVTGWQKTQAAALLGITRTTLYAKVKQYNIKRNSQDCFNLAVVNDLQDNITEDFEPRSVLNT
ncbi:MAG: hypothetical protein A2173_07235 [Planctomycetes bacterium RBG_13_44_8b]|nr:MAG: hypothetical protein A2173_07235 [Planctomycetes bacterium RBG_13_44_8b]